MAILRPVVPDVEAARFQGRIARSLRERREQVECDHSSAPVPSTGSAPVPLQAMVRSLSIVDSVRFPVSVTIATSLTPTVNSP